MKGDWKHYLIGAVMVVAPPLLNYLVGLPWNRIDPTWATTIGGALQIANEYFTNNGAKA